MSEPITEGWLTTDQAQTLTGYARTYLRLLASRGRVEARKVGRDWLLNRENLLAYKARMDALLGGKTWLSKTAADNG
jgi:excisionase family DNA binding protein